MIDPDKMTDEQARMVDRRLVQAQANLAHARAQLATVVAVLLLLGVPALAVFELVAR